MPIPSNNTRKKESIIKVLLNILKLIGFVVLISIPDTILFLLLDVQNQLTTKIHSILSLLIFVLMFMILIFTWSRYYKYSGERVQKIKWRDIRFVILFLFIMQAIFITSTLFTQWLYGEEMTANDEFIKSIMDHDATFAPYFILFVLSSCLFFPMGEELIFRGMSVHLLFKKRSLWLPLIITAVVFGLSHGPENVVALSMYVFFGVALFLAYYRRKNILDSMLVHIFHNILVTIHLIIFF